MIIQTESGVKLELPDGSSPAQVEEAISHYESTTQKQDKGPSSLRSFAVGAGQTATMGLSDEIGARLLAIGPRTYEEMLPAVRNELAKVKQNEGAYLAGELAGSVLTGATGGAAIARSLPNAAATMAARPIATAIGTGAASGGLYAAGTGEGGLGKRAESAVAGSLYGGAGGAIGGLVASKVIAPLTERATKLVARYKTGRPQLPVESTVNQISDLAPSAVPTTGPQNQYDLKAQQLVSAAARKSFGENADMAGQVLKQSDQPIAEAYTPEITRLARGAAQYPSGQAVADKYFGEKIAGVPNRLNDAIGKNISGVQNFYATVDDVLAAGRKKASPLYTKAFSNRGAANSERIQQFLAQPELKTGLKRGLEIQRLEALADNVEFNPSDYAIRSFNEAGDPVIGEVPNMRLLDAGKRGLDAMISDETDKVTSEVTELGRALKAVRKSYLNELDNLNPDYKAARAAAGDYFETTKAMDLGKSFSKQDPELVGKEFSKLGNAEKDAYKIGVAKAMREAALLKAEKGQNPYNSVFVQNQARLSKILPPKEYENLKQAFAAEDKLFKMRNEVLGGSQTAGKAVDAAAIGSLADEVGRSLITADPRGAGLSIVRAAYNSVVKGMNDKTAEAVSKVLYETDPVKKLALVQSIAGSKSLNEAEKQMAKEAVFKALDAINANMVGAFAGGQMAGKQDVKKTTIEPSKTNQLTGNVDDFPMDALRITIPAPKVTN